MGSPIANVIIKQKTPSTLILPFEHKLVGIGKTATTSVVILNQKLSWVLI